MAYSEYASHAVAYEDDLSHCATTKDVVFSYTVVDKEKSTADAEKRVNMTVKETVHDCSCSQNRETTSAVGDAEDNGQSANKFLCHGKGSTTAAPASASTALAEPATTATGAETTAQCLHEGRSWGCSLGSQTLVTSISKEADLDGRAFNEKQQKDMSHWTQSFCNAVAARNTADVAAGKVLCTAAPVLSKRSSKPSSQQSSSSSCNAQSDSSTHSDSKGQSRNRAFNPNESANASNDCGEKEVDNVLFPWVSDSPPLPFENPSCLREQFVEPSIDPLDSSTDLANKIDTPDNTSLYKTLASTTSIPAAAAAIAGVPGAVAAGAAVNAVTQCAVSVSSSTSVVHQNNEMSATEQMSSALSSKSERENSSIGYICDLPPGSIGINQRSWDTCTSDSASSNSGGSIASSSNSSSNSSNSISIDSSKHRIESDDAFHSDRLSPESKSHDFKESSSCNSKSDGDAEQNRLSRGDATSSSSSSMQCDTDECYEVYDTRNRQSLDPTESVQYSINKASNSCTDADSNSKSENRRRYMRTPRLYTPRRSVTGVDSAASDKSSGEGWGRGSQEEAASDVSVESVSSRGSNDSVCLFCKGGGELVCCEGCPNSFHSGCLNAAGIRPPQLTDNEWFCTECVASSTNSSSSRGLVDRPGPFVENSMDSRLFREEGKRTLSSSNSTSSSNETDLRAAAGRRIEEGFEEIRKQHIAAAAAAADGTDRRVYNGQSDGTTGDNVRGALSRGDALHDYAPKNSTASSASSCEFLISSTACPTTEEDAPSAETAHAGASLQVEEAALNEQAETQLSGKRCAESTAVGTIAEVYRRPQMDSAMTAAVAAPAAASWHVAASEAGSSVGPSGGAGGFIGGRKRRRRRDEQRINVGPEYQVPQLPQFYLSTASDADRSISCPAYSISSSSCLYNPAAGPFAVSGNVFDCTAGGPCSSNSTRYGSENSYAAHCADQSASTESSSSYTGGYYSGDFSAGPQGAGKGGVVYLSTLRDGAVSWPTFFACIDIYSRSSEGMRNYLFQNSGDIRHSPLEARLVYSPHCMESRRQQCVAAGLLGKCIKSQQDLAEFLEECARRWKARPGWQPYSPEFAYKLLHRANYDPGRALKMLEDPGFSFNDVCDPPLRKYENKWKRSDKRGTYPPSPYPPPVALRAFLQERGRSLRNW